MLEFEYKCEAIVDVCVPLTAVSSECLSPVLRAPVPVSDSCEDPGLSSAVPVCEDDNDLMGDELDSLLDSVSREDAPRVRNVHYHDDFLL